MTIDRINGSSGMAVATDTNGTNSGNSANADITNLVVSTLAAYCEQNQLVLVVDTATALEQLQLDSLALMEVVYELEETLDITLDQSSLQTLYSVGDLIAAIQRVRKCAA